MIRAYPYFLCVKGIFVVVVIVILVLALSLDSAGPSYMKSLLESRLMSVSSRLTFTSFFSLLFLLYFFLKNIIAFVLQTITVETTLPLPPHTPTHKMRKILEKKLSGMFFVFSAYGNKSPASPSPTLIDGLFCLYIKARMSQIFPCEFHLLVMSSANPY